MLRETVITAAARRQCAAAMYFTEVENLSLPPVTEGKERLLYLHIPFCESLCPYCSFNRVIFDEPLARSYFRALRREIDLYFRQGYSFSGVYVGGGTPTIMMDELVETLSLARKRFPIQELSVETNPNHLTGETVTALQSCGVNRLSVGVQSFDDGLLRTMGRFEKYGSGREIARRLRECEGLFDTLNADMIFNFPSQNEESLLRDCGMLLDLGIDQVTYYPLMVSDSTRNAVERTMGPVDYGKEKRLYALISESLIPPYHPSSAWCFSLRGGMIDEYIVDYDEYAGLGSGSIGYLGGSCYANTFHIVDYVDRVNRDEFPIMATRRYSRRERLRYDFLMKLFGLTVPSEFFRRKYGVSPARGLWKEILAFLLVGGVRCDSDGLRLTRRGRYFWVIMMREFFIAVNNFRDFCLNKAAKER